MQRRKQVVHDVFVQDPDRSTRNAVRQLAGSRAAKAGGVEDAAAQVARAAPVWKMKSMPKNTAVRAVEANDRRESGFVRLQAQH